ncbi:unnamed protein product [Dicrocoelium dendriticum]|nr:unnamed protein product [Dicrocoelium dendriticum]
MLPVAERPNRKVSFSDYVITNSRVEKRHAVPDSSALYQEQLSDVQQRCPTPVDESGHPIVVRLVESKDEEVIAETPLLHSHLPVFEVKLGMVRQATVYHVEFTVPDCLPSGEVELLRYTEDIPGQLDAPVNVGAAIKLLSCDSCESRRGHVLVVELSTTKQPRINEFFTMRLVGNPKEAVHLILHGLSLGRGQGTPFLRLGIHRISENPDFEDSDELTEWPGFVNPADTEEDEADDGRAVESCFDAQKGDLAGCDETSDS